MASKPIGVFVCEACGDVCGISEKWTMLQMLEEVTLNYPEHMKEEMIVLCEDCHKLFSEKIKNKKEDIC